MTIEQFLKYATEMCQKCSENNCEKCLATPGESTCWHSTSPNFSNIEKVVLNWIYNNHTTRKAALSACFPNVECNKNGYPCIDVCTIEPSWKFTRCNQYTTCDECNKEFWLMPLD